MYLSALDLDLFTPASPTAGPVPSGAPSADVVARRFKFLTADGQAATPLEQEAVLGTNDLLDVHFLDRCLLARRCVGRIRVRGGGRTGWATGFLIAPGLLLTNHHVFPTAASVASSSVGFDYWFDIAGRSPGDPDEFPLDAASFYVSDPVLDFAVVAVGARSAAGADIAARGYLRLIPESGKVREQTDFVTILQHPDGVPMQVALRENQVIRAGDDEPYLWYRADTAHGSSGAPVFNDSFQVVALHANGRIKRADGGYVLAAGGTTDRLDGLTESDVVWEANVGFRVSRIAARLLQLAGADWPARLPAIEAAMRGGDVMSTTIDGLAGRGPGPVAAEVPAAPSARAVTADGLTVPITVRLSIEAGGAAAQPTPLESEALELRPPLIYDGLADRPGFDCRFLDPGSDVPQPVITQQGARILAPLLDGDDAELRYRHFSVWMHRERRLALFTAANVDWRQRRKIVDGKVTSRDSLAGWPPRNNYMEQWVVDPRMEARFQLPDVFYSEDRGAFDKGHIVRRDDVCWGERFEEIQMANGDTFHVTNCSPQVKRFNQAAQGQENWGDLEAAIEKVTEREAEAACLYAGPVFGATDRWFRGKDDSGTARIQIPDRFWKIVVVRGADGYEAYGFIIGQDVTAITEAEFYVTPEWAAAWTPISAIADLMRGWLDLGALAAIDQHADA
ncbi:endonuclease G [Sphingomonas guangdongensis]|uniref:Endonuclease G n=1 Tax=Sphingomonas guangdongensis TaxID=1141890 RepID=A0A285QX25_9SPHN|nr:DNA/RNA non-specific endonuclease [Sphingomonas guangdongensis]SOB86391.1 endonuclease G [Sphingomonas guangdongensis]